MTLKPNVCLKRMQVFYHKSKKCCLEKVSKVIGIRLKIEQKYQLRARIYLGSSFEEATHFKEEEMLGLTKHRGNFWLEEPTTFNRISTP